MPIPEKHEPVSDIDTAVVDSLRERSGQISALWPNWSAAFDPKAHLSG